MRIAFLGTPDFAIPSLKMLYERGDDIAVFTQPDRPRGRGHGIAISPVKQFGLEKKLSIFQFEKIRSAEGLDALRAFAPELMVTVAFGQLLSRENLDIPRYGCINVHASLLPRYRGAAPIQWSIINGESITGVTTMLTDVGLDTGDILLSQETHIGEDETAGELYERLALMGAELLRTTIDRLEHGTLVAIPQPERLATKCGIIKKEMAKLDFSRNALSVHNTVRGMNPSPVAFTYIDGALIKVYRTRKAVELDGQFESAKCGECVIADAKKGLYIKCGENTVIEALELQFAGSKRVEARAALNSRKLIGRILG